MFAPPAHLLAALPWTAIQAAADAAAPPGPASAGFTAIRFAMYTALVLLIGAALFVLLLVRRVRALGLGSDQFAEEASDLACRLALVGAWVLVLATPARLIAQAISVDVSAWTVLGTSWGRAWMAQMTGAIVALAALLGARQVAVRRWRIAGAGAVLIAFGFAFSGHAATAPHLGSLSIAADIVHLVAAGAWIGTLAVVALAGIPVAMRAPEGTRGGVAAALVVAFHPLALLSVGTLVITGTFAAWDHIGGVGALLHTDYGQALLWKLGAVAIVAAIGAVNSQILLPRLGTEAAALGMRRSAIREIAVALLVLLITAVLVAKATPAEMAEAAVPAAPLTTSLLTR